MNMSLGGEGERPRSSVLGKGSSEGLGALANAGQAKFMLPAERTALRGDLTLPVLALLPCENLGPSDTSLQPA